MFHFQPINLPFEIPPSLLESMAHCVEDCVEKFGVQKHAGTVTLSILDDERMRELNQTYR